MKKQTQQLTTRITHLLSTKPNINNYLNTKIKFLATSVLSLSCLLLAPQANAADPAEYFVGEYTLFGYDTAAEDLYAGKVTLSKNAGHFLNIKIENYEADMTYYGQVTQTGKNQVRIDYKNIGSQKHSATCQYNNDVNNFASFDCTGSLLGNVGGEGVFRIKVMM